MKLSRIVTRLLAATTVIVGLTAAIAMIPADSPRDGALSWVRTLSPAARAHYLAPERLATLPIEYRKSLYGSLATADERARFWRGNISTYSATHTLSSEQRAALAQAESLVTPALFESNTPQASTRATAAQVGSIVASALGTTAAEALLVTAGPSVTSGGTLPASERIRPYWRTERPARAVAALLDRAVPTLHANVWYCDCNIQSECSGHQNCDPNEACNYAEIGCGFMWMGFCQYKCTFPHNY